VSQEFFLAVKERP
jgi:hypothetical protein